MSFIDKFIDIMRLNDDEDFEMSFDTSPAI